MIKITDKIWLGSSHDAEHADLKPDKITAILSCVHDLEGKRGWTDGVEFAQCGLVDGPGNTMAAYHAAVLRLAAFVLGGRKTLVHDHHGMSQAVFAVICVLQLLEGRMGWDHWLNVIKDKQAILDGNPHEEHCKAFNRLNWRLLSSVLDG